MTTDEAIEVCNQWFRHNERQREKALELQRLAALARTGPDGQKEAKRRMSQIDRQPKVFDGARLEPAVKQIIKALSC